MKHLLPLVTSSIVLGQPTPPVGTGDAPSPDDIPPGFCQNGDYIYQCDDGKGLHSSITKWNNWIENGKYIVPYFIDSSAQDSTTTDALQSGIDEIEAKTHIEFREVDPNNCPNCDGIIKIIKGSGCYSYLGRIHFWDTQDLSLGNGCAWRSTVVHEFLHALGWIHEQSRMDRDEFITVHFENIPSNWHSQWDKSNSDYSNTEYDYVSVMHYGEYAASSNGEKTMTRKDGGSGLGQPYSTGGLSEKDAIEVNTQSSSRYSGPVLVKMVPILNFRRISDIEAPSEYPLAFSLQVMTENGSY